MMLWHPLLVHLQEDLIQATSSSAACDLSAPDIVIHAGGQNSVACVWGEKGTGDAAAVTFEFTDC